MQLAASVSSLWGCSATGAPPAQISKNICSPITGVQAVIDINTPPPGGRGGALSKLRVWSPEGKMSRNIRSVADAAVQANTINSQVLHSSSDLPDK